MRSVFSLKNAAAAVVVVAKRRMVELSIFFLFSPFYKKNWVMGWKNTPYDYCTAGTFNML